MRTLELPSNGELPQTELRVELERLTTELTHERIAEQEPAIAALRDRFPHTLLVVGAAVSGRPETYRFTCFQYAFNLTDPPEEFERIYTRFPEVFPGAEFVQFLIDRHLTERPLSAVETGDVVVYFAAGRPIHAAVIDGTTLVSKWGLAHLWRHGIAEVPEGYGQTIRAFSSISPDAALEAFLKFAATKLGVELSSD